MPIKKGTILNPTGRPKNSINKTTGEIRQAFQLLVENNLEQLEVDLKNCDAEKRIGFIIKLSEFFLPRMQSISIENQLDLEYKQLEVLLSKATPEAIEAITSKILTLKIQSDNENS
jgi:hypothetical protein